MVQPGPSQWWDGVLTFVRVSVACVGPPFKWRTYPWNSIGYEKPGTTDPTPDMDGAVSCSLFSLTLLSEKKPVSKGYVPRDSVYNSPEVTKL